MHFYDGAVWQVLQHECVINVAHRHSYKCKILNVEFLHVGNGHSVSVLLAYPMPITVCHSLLLVASI